MKGFYLLAVYLTLSTAVFAKDMTDVGSIHFPTSAPPEAQAHFLRGVAILHSFGWKQARTEFQLAQKVSPDFALAYWGEALTYNHPLIAEWDIDTPRKVLLKLGKTREARLAKAPSAREKGFLAAVDALFFGPDDTLTRRKAYMEHMRALYEDYPDDNEVAAHYALSLLMSAEAGEQAHRQNVLAGAIAMRISEENPRHPGAVHYTIHAFDDPVHAPLALSAARIFDDIAPAVSHARHMPTHIFIQLGLWQQVSTSNQDAYDVALALWQAGDKAGDMTHALDWGQYGDLQRGDYARAEMWIKRMQTIVANNPGQGRVLDTLPGIKARLLIETERWQTDKIDKHSHAGTLLATGLSAVHLGHLKLAQQAVELLAAKAAQVDNSDRSYYAASAKPLQIMQLELAGMLSIAKGKVTEGLDLLAQAVEIDESMRAPNGPPKTIKPAHELYAEALLAADRPAEAMALFSTSLQRMPNRALSLRGLARAYAALGQVDSARQTYQQLLAVWQDRNATGASEANKYLRSIAAD